MNSINVNIPVINQPQITQQQADVHRAPMVHQTQNAEIARDRFDQHMRIANEAEAAEGKTVDPDDHKEQQPKHHKGEHGEENENGEGEENDGAMPLTMSDNGHLIDLEA